MVDSLYVEALLADEDLADQVWELWNAGLIGAELAEIAWWIIAKSAFTNSSRSLS